MGCKFKKTAHALLQIFWGPWHHEVIAVVWVTKELHFYIYLRVILKEPETVDEKKIWFRLCKEAMSIYPRCELFKLLIALLAQEAMEMLPFKRSSI